ncbi:MAG: anhydro-N-acetylmuramic acid kinase [Methyloprofundus sp.]|nr:anhydro-N-acetylmuramic acid kinase [Methyloprofundus sp.]
MQRDYYIGLMSGTSLDGIDAGLYDFTKQKAQVVDFYYQAYPAEIKEKIQSISNGSPLSLTQYGELDTQLGEFYAQACLSLLKQNNTEATTIKAIGSHGQTLYHSPNTALPFSLQIGDPNIICQRTGITTVADFRRKDIAAGGQGAPLVPAFHRALFSNPDKNNVIVNIGGIANITILPKDASKPVVGFDTGPGNTLMNHWISQQQNKAYDHNGSWAITGKTRQRLLSQLKSDAYFSQTIPKSTGTEYFSEQWLKQNLSTQTQYKPEDVQRTLCQLTAESIAEAILLNAPETDNIFICGGGIYNKTLMSCLGDNLEKPLLSTETLGVPPDQVEAMAFAWLAKQTLEGMAGNLPEATGASSPVILGAIYQA